MNTDGSLAAEMIREVAESRRPYIITQHGEAKVVLQDPESYEQLQESVALLKLLAQSGRSLAEGRTRPASAVLDGRRDMQALLERRLLR